MKKAKGITFPCPHCKAAINISDDSARLNLAYGARVTRKCGNCLKDYEIVLTLKKTA